MHIHVSVLWASTVKIVWIMRWGVCSKHFVAMQYVYIDF